MASAGDSAREQTQGSLAGSAFGLNGGIHWRPALQAALMLGVPAGVLCFGILPLGLLGIVAAAYWAVGLYARRVRTVSVSISVGAQIGVVTGLFASLAAGGLYGIGLWVSRFVLHEGAELDALWTSQVEKSNQQVIEQMGAANAQSAQSIRAMMLSAEGRAGLAVLGLLVVAAFLIALAVAGGAVGAKLATAPRRSGA